MKDQFVSEGTIYNLREIDMLLPVGCSNKQLLTLRQLRGIPSQMESNRQVLPLNAKVL